MRRLLYISRQYGLDPVKLLIALRNTPRFVIEFLKFKHKLPNSTFLPSVLDYSDSSGAADGHYFWQDLIVAKWIYEEKPISHVDLGSRVDGFIAHLLTFREVTQIDIRKMDSTIPHLKFIQRDILKENNSDVRKFDSASSLHSIEHFGLGRYGDPLVVDGHIQGLKNLAEMVKPGGKLYISFPIGKSEVQFNSQRILEPNFPLGLLEDFRLLEFVVVPWKGSPIYGKKPQDFDVRIKGSAGIYKFERMLN